MSDVLIFPCYEALIIYEKNIIYNTLHAAKYMYI